MHQRRSPMSDFTVAFPVREIAEEVVKILSEQLPGLNKQVEEQLISTDVAERFLIRR